MSSKQTRRSISISGELYQALTAHAAEAGQGLSTVVEATMRAKLGLSPKTAVDRTPRPRRSRAKKEAPAVAVAVAAEPVAPPVEAPPKSRFITNTLKLTRPPRNPSERYGMPKRPETEPSPPALPNAKSIFTF